MFGVQFGGQFGGTGFVPNNDINISLPVDTVTIADYAPVINTGASVSLPLDSVTVTDYAPGVQLILTIELPVDGVTIADYAPTVGTGALVELPLDSVTISDYAPGIELILTLELPVDELTITDYAPTAGGGAKVDLPLDSVTIADYAVEQSLIITGFPRFYLNRSGTTITITFTNRGSKEVQIYRASEYNNSFSSLAYTTSDEYTDNASTSNYKYKCRFVDRDGGTVVASSKRSISKFTKN